MPSIKVYNMKGQETGTMELGVNFEVAYNEALIHQAVVTHLANERQGTKSSLTRSEVRGGGKKPYRQKGTGSARQGSTRAPQWIKGGVVFAPKSRDFSKKMNRKAKYAAFLSALSKKVADGQLYVIDEIAVENGKTKEMVAFLDAFKFDKTVLMVMANDDVKVIRAAANIPTLSTIHCDLVSTYDVVKNAVVVMAKEAVEAFIYVEEQEEVQE